MENILVFNIFILLIFFLLNTKAYEIANFLKLFDQPNKRKIHKKKIPLIGGVLIWFVFGISLFFQNILKIFIIKVRKIQLLEKN